MLGKSIRCVLAGLAIMLLAQDAGARLPPPPVPLDVLLKEADRIVVGRAQPGSVKHVVGLERKKSFHELTLIVTRSLDGKDIGKQVTVTMGSFPAKVFPADKKHASERFRLTGWGAFGHTEQEEKGLDLYAEQVWFLERFRADRLRDPKSAPLGVDHFESAQKLEHAGLIELFTRQANVGKLRKHIEKEYKGKIPLLAVQGLCGSRDPGAGALVWDYLQEYEALARKLADLSKKDGDEIIGDERRRIRLELNAYWPYDAFRTLNSLGRDEALKWARKSLDSADLRSGALEACKRYQDTASVPRLIQLLRNANAHDERDRLIATLGKIGDPRAIPTLLELLPDDKSRQNVSRALFELTDIRLSPNGDYAKRWWERNKTKPRWHWLKQGIEQDLHLLAGRYADDWDLEFNPTQRLGYKTCWRQQPASGPELSAAWAKWWQANKDLPQERWILDSFKAVGHPLPDLASKEAVDALVKAYNTEPDYWWKDGPAIDGNHHAWCQQLLTRLTGWDVVDTHYLHSTRSSDYQKMGPRWQAEWQKSRYGVTLKPIDIPAKQPFTMADEDRRLLCEDFGCWRAEAVFKGPLVRRQFPGLQGKSIVATFEVTLTNQSTRELTLHTKPEVGGASGRVEGFGSSLSPVKWQCTSHDTDFATLRPGQSIRWIEQHTLYFGDPEDEQKRAAEDRGKAWCYFRLHFEERGKTGLGWRGHVATPWISVKKENIRDE